MRLFLLFLCSCLLAGCTEATLASHVIKTVPGKGQTEGDFKVGKPYKVQGQWYKPQEDYHLVETGIASWYGPGFNGKKTANGEKFDKHELTAAHRTLQMPSLVRVTNLDNGRSVVVRINDRGPFKRGRVIDVSERAAELLGFKGHGTAKVRLEVLTKESQAVAMAAKRGEDTRGVEVALNEDGRLPASMRGPAGEPVSGKYPTKTVYKPQPIERVDREPITTSVPGHTKDGEFYPDPIVEQRPVTPTTIYIQAGSFTNPDNARSLAQTLQGYGNAGVYPAMVNGKQYYRVRIPMQDVQQADETIEKMARAGNADALVVVD